MLSSGVRSVKDVSDLADMTSRLTWFHDFDRLTDFSDFKGVCDSIKDECKLFDWTDSAVSCLNQALRAGDPWRAKEVLTAIRTAQMEEKGRMPGEMDAGPAEESAVVAESMHAADFVTDMADLQSEGLPSSSALGRRPMKPAIDSGGTMKYEWSGHAVPMCNQLYCAVQVLRARLAVLHTIEKQLMQIETSFLLALKRLKEEKMTVKQQSQELNKLRSENAKLRTENMEMGRDIAVKNREIEELTAEIKNISRSPSKSSSSTLTTATVTSSVTGLRSPPVKSPKLRSGTSSTTGTPSTLTHHSTPDHLLSPKMAKSGTGKKSGSKKKKKKHGKQGSVADLFIANIAETLQTELESRLNNADSDEVPGTGTAKLVIEIADTPGISVSPSPSSKKKTKKKDSTLESPEKQDSEVTPGDKPRTSMSDIVFAKSFAAKWAKRGKKKAKAKKKAEASKKKGTAGSGSASVPASASSSGKFKKSKKKKKKKSKSTQDDGDTGDNVSESAVSVGSSSKKSTSSVGSGKAKSTATDGSGDGVSVMKKSELNDVLFAKVETVVHSSQELEEAAGESYKKREATATKLETVRKIAADIAQATDE